MPPTAKLYNFMFSDPFIPKSSRTLLASLHNEPLVTRQMKSKKENSLIKIPEPKEKEETLKQRMLWGDLL